MVFQISGQVHENEAESYRHFTSFKKEMWD